MRTAPRSKKGKRGSKKELSTVPQETIMTNIFEAAQYKTASTEVSNEERHQLIAEAAYFRAKQRSFEPGLELEDWLRAETEIERRLSQVGKSNLHKNT